MRPEVEQCTRRKAIKAIQTADEYLILTAEGIKATVAWNGGKLLLAALATALHSNPELRDLVNKAVILVVTTP